MKNYDHKKIEKKWQSRWEKESAYRADDVSEKPKDYLMIEFPYPSGEGLHVGHVRSWTALDVLARKRRAQGYNVLYPIGWDAFGLPTENYALKTGRDPRIVTKENTDNFRRQIKSLGLSFDWSREINTTDSSYYKWTQWLFLQFFKKGLTYKAKTLINWCPKDKIGLANEEVVDGCCERCGTPVEKREKEQWMMAITKYAQRLYDDLDTVDYIERAKTEQRNWIGPSDGAEISFSLSWQRPRMRIVFATNNLGKLKRMRKLFEEGHIDIELLMPKDIGIERFDVSEDARTLEENSEKKARALAALTDLPVFADDSGFFIDGEMIDPIAVKRNALAGDDEKSLSIEEIGGRMQSYYADIARKRGGKVDAEWRNNLCFITPGKVATHIETTRPVILTSESHGAVDPYLPLRGLYISKATGKYVLEQTDAEESLELGPITDGLKKLFMQSLTVFTTRPDTLFGATYMVLAPEHPLVSMLANEFDNKDEVIAYQTAARNKSDIDRTAEGKEKTGVELKGIKAINPANKKEIPIFIADYVLGSYGTGAIMAVPAHDERDGAFAKKYGLPIIQSVTPDMSAFEKTEKVLTALDTIYEAAKKKDIKFWVLGGLACAFYAKIIYREFEDIDLITKDDNSYQKLLTLFGELGFHKVAEKKISENLTNSILKNDEGIEIDIGPYIREFDCQDDDFEEQEKSLNHHTALVLSQRFVKKFKEQQLKNRGKDKDKIDWEYLNDKFFVDDGFLVNSGTLSGLPSDEAKKMITEFVGGKMVTTFKLRDWVFSRQRYWGEPIPMIHCERCGWQPVPEDQLPVTLPEVEKYEPTETGESPLANITKWVNTKCPKCGGDAKRETDVMPNWAGSSWYYLRYIDPQNTHEFASPDLMKYWTPVNWYNGGMEHTVLHLLYSRFWHKFLFDQGLVPSPEPYMKRTSHGLILAEDGSKMSKSKGNSVSPDALVESVGADSLRLYEMFIGPFDQPVAWNNNGVVGMRRFLERVADIKADNVTKLEPPLETLLHQTIKKVSDDIEKLKMNTAVSALMILLNEYEKLDSVSSEAYETFLKLLAPFAPHLTHELWEKSGHPTELRLEPWPVADETKSKGTTAHIAIQINGKTRGEIDAAIDSDKSTLENLAHEAVVEKLDGKTVSRVIIVPNRLVNFVVVED